MGSPESDFEEDNRDDIGERGDGVSYGHHAMKRPRSSPPPTTSRNETPSAKIFLPRTEDLIPPHRLIPRKTARVTVPHFFGQQISTPGMRCRLKVKQDEMRKFGMRGADSMFCYILNGILAAKVSGL